jgi:hypothetical protein
MVDTIEVRQAPRCLLHRCPERWPLELFRYAANPTMTSAARRAPP